jgi:hypothetical protein
MVSVQILGAHGLEEVELGTEQFAQLIVEASGIDRGYTYRQGIAGGDGGLSRNRADRAPACGLDASAGSWPACGGFDVEADAAEVGQLFQVEGAEIHRQAAEGRLARLSSSSSRRRASAGCCAGARPGNGRNQVYRK